MAALKLPALATIKTFLASLRALTKLVKITNSPTFLSMGLAAQSVAPPKITKIYAT
jgi:hypothetical protein